MGASQVLALALNTGVKDGADPQLCSSLVQMGSVERLSQLLCPVIKTTDQQLERIQQERHFGTGNVEEVHSAMYEAEEIPDQGKFLTSNLLVVCETVGTFSCRSWY